MKREIERKPGFNLLYLAIIIVILLALLFLIMNQSSEKEPAPVVQEKKVKLFNGTDLSNWEFFLVDSLIDPATIFKVNGNLIRIEGEPFGYMRTVDEYKDYKLHVEWRWPEEESNSGVFLNISGEDKKWPATIECQLKAGNAGDFVFLGDSDAIERVDKSNLVIAKKEESNEKPSGEWNEYDIHCMNDSIIVYVNGTLQNRCTDPAPNSGHIGLQSEGKPIEFRNVYLVQF